MKMRGGIGGCLVLALAVSIAPLGAAEESEKDTAPRSSSRPPKNLKKLPDGHWTPWDPPTPPPGATVHTVVPGDTLWDLSAQHLKNPYLWPQIWDQNRYVLDSHWIYPGDPIVLPSPEIVPSTPQMTMTPSPSLGEEEDEGMDEGAAPAAQAAAPQPSPSFAVADMQDVLCAAEVVDSVPADDPHIVAAEDEDMIGIGQGHIVYLNAGTDAGWKPGDRFTVIRDRGTVKHPATKDDIGRRVDGMGQLILIAVQGSSSTAEITFACEDLHRGDPVVPLRRTSVPTRNTPLSGKIDRYNPNSSGKASGYVVVSKDPAAALGQGSVVAVDLGQSQGVAPGEMLTIFRPNPSGEDLPRLNLGEGVVVMTGGSSAVVKITASVREIYLGDRVEVR